MKSIDEIKRVLGAHKEELRLKYGVSKIGVFGSYVRSEAGQESDIDILVDFEKPIGLIRFVGLKNHLSDILGVEVDLVMRKALKPGVDEQVLKEVVYV